MLLVPSINGRFTDELVKVVLLKCPEQNSSRGNPFQRRSVYLGQAAGYDHPYAGKLVCQAIDHPSGFTFCLRGHAARIHDDEIRIIGRRVNVIPGAFQRTSHCFGFGLVYFATKDADQGLFSHA
jgi:hypothetical protein